MVGDARSRQKNENQSQQEQRRRLSANGRTRIGGRVPDFLQNSLILEARRIWQISERSEYVRISCCVSHLSFYRMNPHAVEYRMHEIMK